MCHNIYAAIMALHYRSVVQGGGCPIVIAQGGCETGKSTAISHFLVNVMIISLYS